MRRIVDPKSAEVAEINEVVVKEPPSTDIQYEDLLDKTKTLLYRELMQLHQASLGKLLNKDQSQSLVNYIRLLKDLVKEEKELLKNLSDEELEKLAKGKE